jgi:sugar phosphate isomerase/epimerase
MPDRAALNLASLGPAPLESKLYAAAAAGFRAVGLVREEMQKAGEDGERELRLSQLAPAELMGVAGWMAPDRASRAVAMAQAEIAFELAAALGCSVVVAWPPMEAVDSVAAARAFADLCRLAEALGVRVGLEFLGNSEGVNTLASAWEIVELAEAPNGGLVIDAFHFHRGGSSPAMLEPVTGDKIFLVQICDAVDLPARDLHDRHRVYPGSGAIPLEPLLSAVRDKGYSGYYSLELHNEGYWQQDPLLVAREGLRAVTRFDLT